LASEAIEAGSGEDQPRYPGLASGSTQNLVERPIARWLGYGNQLICRLRLSSRRRSREKTARDALIAPTMF
jgi:hypothetical protein